MEANSNGNIFYFTQLKPLYGEEGKIDLGVFESKAFREVVKKCELDPLHVYRVVIDQGYLSDEDFGVVRRFYNANMVYQKLPSNLVLNFTGNQKAVDDGYTPAPFVDADKEWYKKFKAACEVDPNVIHTITIEEGNRERGDFLDYVFSLMENLPDNARVIKKYNKAHDVDDFSERFKHIDFEFDPKIAEQIAKNPNHIQIVDVDCLLLNHDKENTPSAPQQLPEELRPRFQKIDFMANSDFQPETIHDLSDVESHLNR